MKLCNELTYSEQQSLVRIDITYHLTTKYIILMSHSLEYIQVQSVLFV